MNTFVSLVLYVLIGSTMAAFMDNDYRSDCGKGLPIGEIAYMTAAWPAVVPVILFSDAEPGGYDCGEAEQ